MGNNPAALIDPFGLWEIRCRPLNSRPGRTLAKGVYGEGNIQGQHWQIFYDNGANSGYLGDKKRKPIFGADDAPEDLQRQYTPHPNSKMKGTDDERMRQAERIVQKRFREQKRRYNHPMNDCQSYAMEVVYEYYKLP